MNYPEPLAAALERFFGTGAVRDPVPVVGLATNRSWLVTVDGTRIVAKLPEHRGGLTAGSALEYEILRKAAELGVSPKPLGIDAATGVLFIAALSNCSELDPDTAAEEPVIAQVAAAAGTLHMISAPPALRSFDPVHFAEEYLSVAKTDRAERLRDEIQRLTDRCGHQLVGAGICHNDLHAANVLIGERLWLIDFEYAVRAAPIVDVASYAAFNGLDEQAALLFAMHCLDEDLPFSAEQLNEAVRIQRLLGELWEIARSDNNARS